MNEKKRAAFAAVVSGSVGSAAGLVASHYGLDLQKATEFGATVSSAAAHLLYQALRLTPDGTGGTHWDTGASGNNTGTPADAESDIVNVTSAVSDTGNIVETTSSPGNAESDTADTTADVSDTGENTNGAGPPAPVERERGTAQDRKHPRHHKLVRGARRRVKQHERDGQDGHDDRRKEYGRGTS